MSDLSICALWMGSMSGCYVTQSMIQYIVTCKYAAHVTRSRWWVIYSDILFQRLLIITFSCSECKDTMNAEQIKDLYPLHHAVFQSNLEVRRATAYYRK